MNKLDALYNRLPNSLKALVVTSMVILGVGVFAILAIAVVLAVYTVLFYIYEWIGDYFMLLVALGVLYSVIYNEITEDRDGPL